jgi:hypothetical protein
MRLSRNPTTHLTPSSPPRRRRTSAELTRLVTAYHEAGHCVVALVLKGPRPKAVTIEPDPGNAALLGRSDIDLGFVDTLELMAVYERARLRVPWHTTLRQAADMYAQISLAGTIASRRVARHSTAAHWETFYQHTDQGDWGICQRVLRPFVSSEAELWAEVQRLRRETQVLVRQPRVWAAITYLAEALVRTPTLEGEEIDLVLEGVQRRLEGGGLA